MEHDKICLGAQFNADGTRILTWSWDGTAHLWDSNTGKQALSTPLRHDKAVRGAQFSSDGSRILTWSSDGTAWLWASESGEPVAPPIRHTGAIRGAQFGAGVSRVLTWSEGGDARLWDSRTGDAITPPLKGDSPVRSARFSGDESHLEIQSPDGSAQSLDISIDQAWPADKSVLRVEVQTGTKLTQTGELKALDPAEWQRKRWCEYDGVRHDLGRLSKADWSESERLCRNAGVGAKPSP